MLLSECRDQQASALQKLAGKNYSLSVAEFFKAAKNGDEEAIGWFIQAGVEPDVTDGEGGTALNMAARAGSVRAIDALLKHGAHLPVDDAAVNRLLGDSVRSHDLATLNALLALDLKPTPGRTDVPLAVAATEDDRAMIDALLPLSAGQVDTALFAAAKMGGVSVISTLLNAGASVFARTSEEARTPLMIAAQEGHHEAVDLLLGAGADRFAVDAKGFIAGEHAQAALHAALANRLLEPASAEESRVHPLIDGAAVHVQLASLGDQLMLTGCRERVMPFALEAISGTSATVRLLEEKRSVTLELGAPLPDTPWKLDKLKLGGAVFKQAGGQERFMLTKDCPARHGLLCAVIRVESTGGSFEASEGDRFHLAEDSSVTILVKKVAPLAVTLVNASDGKRQWKLVLAGRNR